MWKLKFQFLVVAVAVAAAVGLAEAGRPQHGLIHQIREGVAGPNPYIFLTVPKNHSQSAIQGFEVIEDMEQENAHVVEKGDTEEEGNENSTAKVDDHDHVEEQDGNRDIPPASNMNVVLELKKSANQTAKAIKAVVSPQHPANRVKPQEFIEIEGQTGINGKTGQSVLLLPHSVLDLLPDGSIVTVMERSPDGGAEGRATRFVVRRRRKGNFSNVQSFGGGNKRYRVVKQNNNKRRFNFRRPNVIIVRRRNGNKAGVNRRRIYLQS